MPAMLPSALVLSAPRAIATGFPAGRGAFLALNAFGWISYAGSGVRRFGPARRRS